MNAAARVLVPHAVSLTRPLVGLALVSTVRPGGDSLVVAAAVAAACVSDWIDGRLARRLGATSAFGRLFDNLCDFVFLALLFAFFAAGEIWSPPIWGRLVRHYDGANWLPLWALLASFGLYLARLLPELAAGREPERSPRGHAAGVANYGLAIGGAVELLPWVRLGPWILEPGMLTVVLLNAFAVGENLRLMLRRSR